MFTKFIFAAALLIAMPATAGTFGEQPPSLHVRATGLDLNTDAGAREMWTRIHKAAVTVCEPPQDMLDAVRQRMWQSCIADAQVRAVAALGNAKVSALAANAPKKTLIASR